MNETKIVVPDGMMSAAKHAFMQNKGVGLDGVEDCIEAALLWLSENPIVPTDEQVEELRNEHVGLNLKWMLSEWQRRMFIAPAPEVPEAIKDLLIDERDEREGFYLPSAFNQQIREAYRRGQKDGKQ